jgi:transposase
MEKMIKFIAKNKDIFVGLEDSKRSWKLCVRSEKIVIQETSMPAKYEALKSYFRNNFPGCKIKIIYEAGFKGFTLHDRLISDGFECVVTPPHTVTQEKDNRVKCDKIDARRLALNLENGDYKTCCVPDKELREDRQISRMLIQVQKDINKCKNRIRKFLDFHGYDEEFPAGTWYEREYKALEEFKFPEPLNAQMDIYLSTLKHFAETKKKLTELLKALTKKKRYARVFELFESAPGVGWYTAIRLILEWGTDIAQRFKTDKKIASFTGLTSSEFSTGETVKRGRITGQGNRSVRAWLIESAWTAYKRDPALLHKFQEVYQHTSSKKKAIVAVARKLAVRLRALVGTDTPYQIGVAR